MSKNFIKLIKKAISNNCDEIKLDNESDRFTIYLMSGNIGFSINSSAEEISDIFRFLKRQKAPKGKFKYMIEKKRYVFKRSFYEDFGEEVFSLKFKEITD